MATKTIVKTLQKSNIKYKYCDTIVSESYNIVRTRLPPLFFLITSPEEGDLKN